MKNATLVIPKKEKGSVVAPATKLHKSSLRRFRFPAFLSPLLSLALVLSPFLNVYAYQDEVRTESSEKPVTNVELEEAAAPIIEEGAVENIDTEEEITSNTDEVIDTAQEEIETSLDTEDAGNEEVATEIEDEIIILDPSLEINNGNETNEGAENGTSTGIGIVGEVNDISQDTEATSTDISIITPDSVISTTSATSTTPQTEEDVEGTVDVSGTQSGGGNSGSNATTTEGDISDNGEEGGQVEEEVLEDILTERSDIVGTSSTTTATSTDESEAASELVSIVTNNDNRYQFSQNECVSVGDGSFYCSVDVGSFATTNNGVYTAKDSDGDKEIFIDINGESIQVTNNVYDDDSPYYDPLSERIVWHSLIEDRFQIMLYERDDGSIRQITDTSYNNMEPTAYDNMITWQAWIGNDWEIMLLENDELIQLTDNETHDIAPHVRGDYILWQSFENDVWMVKIYDRTTELIETVEGNAGASVENPRFVLVYDSKKDNGDVETLGYDFDSKEVVPLTSTPAPAPEKLPESDPTGEERAIVPQQSAPKLESKVKSPAPPDDGDDPNGSEDIDEFSVEAATTTSSPISDVSTTTESVNVPAGEEIGTSTPEIVEAKTDDEENYTEATSTAMSFEVDIPYVEDDGAATTSESQGPVVRFITLSDNST